MIRTEVTITNEYGLESKSAAVFIQKASRYSSSIWLEKENNKVNAKSLLGLLSLGLSGNTKVWLVVDGDDEKIASKELVDFVTAGFEEKF